MDSFKRGLLRGYTAVLITGRREVGVFSGVARVSGEDVVALDVEEGVLGQVSSSDFLVIVLVHQVGLSPEWAETGGFEHFPPSEVLSKVLIPYVNFELELAEGEREAGIGVGLDESCEGVEFPSFDIDLEDINVGMAVGFHQRV